MEDLNLLKPISYIQASKYISKLVENGIAESIVHQIGGVFEAKKLNNWRRKSGFSGYMFWYCLEEGKMKPFIALERREDSFRFPINSLADCEPNKPLVHLSGLRVSQDFVIKKFEKSDKLVDEVYEFLIKDSGKPIKGFKRDGGSSIKKLKDNFLNHPEIRKYQNVGFSYFTFSEDVPEREEDSESYVKFIDKFFDQGKEDVKYIRYYFGLDFTESNQNKFRLILVPVNKEGRNFEMKDLKEEFLVDGPTLLQYSWPPKPTGTDQ